MKELELKCGLFNSKIIKGNFSQNSINFNLSKRYLL